MINQSKSHFTPAQELEVLGFTINTVDMTVRFPTLKVSAAVEACRDLTRRSNPTIHRVSQVIGTLVSYF